jgi:dipeptidyl aminopeptidase/acylaminoacyl peptidase
MRAWNVALGVALSVGPAAVAVSQSVPDSIVAEGVPPIPAGVDEAINRHRFRTLALFAGWFGDGREVLLRAWAGDTLQVFLGERPGRPPRRLTAMPGSVGWALPRPHREQFVLAVDEGGDESHQLFLADMRTGDFTRFTDGRSRHRSVCWSHSGRLLALNSDARDGKDMDLYVLDPSSRATARRLAEARGFWYVADWSPDDRRVVAAEARSDKKEIGLHLIDVETGTDVPLHLPADPRGRVVSIWNPRWSKGGKALYWVTDHDSEFAHLVRYDLVTREVAPLLADAIPWDVEGYDLADDGRTIALAVNEDGLSRLHVVDGQTGRERPAPRLAAGRISKMTFRPNSLEFAFEWTSAQSPPGIYSCDLATGRRTEWVRPESGSPAAGRAPAPELVRFRSFDGLRIPAFLRRPPPRFPGPHPVLIEIHGGPAAQYRPQFDALEDYLVDELGLALIHPNVRGSTGYGRSYEGLDDGRRREDSVKDIGALLDWIATRPDLDGSRVAVSGGSYGGYMVLASLIRYGDRLKAGIDVVGFSSFLTLLRNKRELDRDFARGEYGDERDPAMAAFLRRISPLEDADRIRRPLLVIHGRNDPRVTAAESEQIVAAVRKNGVPVWFIQARGEGHGFARSDNQRYLGRVRVEFLRRYLLGPGS